MESMVFFLFSPSFPLFCPAALHLVLHSATFRPFSNNADESVLMDGWWRSETRGSSDRPIVRILGLSVVCESTREQRQKRARDEGIEDLSLILTTPRSPFPLLSLSFLLVPRRGKIRPWTRRPAM